jgi:Lrp/AsnC family transcriptional regulator for asnA, asnC and gidA
LSTFILTYSADKLKLGQVFDGFRRYSFFYVSGEKIVTTKIQPDTTQLDKTDCGMINLLQKDGRMPIVTLAKKLNIAETTARSRLKKLTDNGVIDIVAVCNPINLGFEIIGSLELTIDLKKKDQIMESLKQIDSLNYIALTTGGTDINVEFIARSLVEFKTLIFEKISHIDGVKSAQTSLILDIVKDTWDYGTAWDIE